MGNEPDFIAVAATIRALTKAQFNCLSSIYCNNEYATGFRTKTPMRLVELGLVVRKERKLGGWPPLTVWYYEMPSIAHHIAWCDVCCEYGEGKEAVKALRSN